MHLSLSHSLFPTSFLISLITNLAFSLGNTTMLFIFLAGLQNWIDFHVPHYQRKGNKGLDKDCDFACETEILI